MSDTPETDAAKGLWGAGSTGMGTWLVPAEKCADMERQRNAARAAIQAMPTCRCGMSTDDQCEMAAKLQAALAEVARLKAGGCARDAGTPASGCSDSSSLFDGYPVIATIDGQEIGAPWKLVAHRNGPAMTNGDIISVIDPHKDDTPRAAELKRKAVRLFREWAWAKLVGEFYPNRGADLRGEASVNNHKPGTA